MKRRVLALGLDAADPTLMEPWMDQGLLPNLNFLRTRGAYGRLRTQLSYGCGNQHEDFSNTEPLWVMAMTGCLPHKTGFWDTVEYDPQRYGIQLDSVYGGYDYGEYKPFYALDQAVQDQGRDRRLNVTAFDVPVTRVIEGVPGTQITGWGGHHPFYPSESNPSEALEMILKQCGPNPVYRQDNGKWWDAKYGQWVQQAIAQSCIDRATIGKALVKRQDWDLCLMGFGETHTAGHDLYDQSQPDHPFHSFRKPNSGIDPLLKAYQQVDEAVGKIFSAAPSDTYFVSYSLHGISANHTDLLSLFFLGEILYRWNFPGKVGFTSGDLSQPPADPIRQPQRGGWSPEIWQQLADGNRLSRWWRRQCPVRFWPSQDNGLTSPTGLKRQGQSQSWMPILAYRHRWPEMRAFALPGFADGQIRINLQGREANGQVAPADYEATCNELIEMLHEFKDSRSGQPLVKSVQRTRAGAGGFGGKGDRPPHADLMVIWNHCPTDVIESPRLGRIGPMTYNRPGGHRARGHFMVQGPGIQPGSQLPAGQAVDVAATLMHLLGKPCPAYFDGQSLLQLDSNNTPQSSAPVQRLNPAAQSSGLAQPVTLAG